MTIGVCGFGRCGSTMVMTMLAAGGMRCVPGAPPYELGDMSEAYRRAWQDDQAVKLLDCVLRFGAPPPARRWRFIWLDRDHAEQARSQCKFLRLLGYDLTDDAEQRFAASYVQDRPRLLAILRRHGTVTVMRYERILANPRRATKVLAGIHRGLDVYAAADVVDDRDGTCRLDLAREIEIAGGTQ